MKKKHHYIPRALVLRNFSDTHFADDYKNKLCFYQKETGEVGSRSVHELGKQNKLYEAKGLEENAVENFSG